MSTSYELIFDKFIKKLKNDKEFLNYTGLTDTDITTLVKDHCIDLLNQAIDKIYEFGNPDINFYDKDDTTEIFNIDLISQEISLLVNLMYQCYLEEDKNKMHFYELEFTSSELNLFSPASNRTSYLKMIENIEINNSESINNYLGRDRKTWLPKSIYKK